MPHAPHDDIRPIAFQAADPFGSDPACDPLPSQILVAPYGEVLSTNGTFVVDAEAMRLTIDAFNAHGTDLPIDFEHQSLGGAYSSPTGLAPAAGWIKSLNAVLPPISMLDAAPPPLTMLANDEDPNEGDGGIPPEPQPPTTEPEVSPFLPPPQAAGLWATVEWTPQAVQLLTARQYRYLSPVALVRRSDQRMIALHSVALTNKPAIVGMQPIVASARHAEGQPIIVKMNPPVNTVDAGRAAGAVDANRATSAADVSAASETAALMNLRQTLAIVDAESEAVLLAASQRITALQNLLDVRAASDRVEQAAAAGKLSPAQHQWAYALALRDPASFDEWLSAAPLLVPLGRTSPPQNDGAILTDAVRRRARDEYRANAATLALICSEEAYIADALRAAVP